MSATPLLGQIADMSATAATRMIELSDLAATETLAAAVAGLARTRDVILLEGEMGAGKSAFARAFLPGPQGNLDCHRAGDFAALVPPHSVGNREDQLVGAFDKKSARVFVVGAVCAHVGQSENVEGRIGDVLRQNSLRLFLGQHEQRGPRKKRAGGERCVETAHPPGGIFHRQASLRRCGD